MNIQVFGSGCPSCKNLYELTKKAVAELGIEAELEYINDITKIIELGVMQSPVLVIDGKIAMLGSANLDKIKEIISKPVCTCGGKC
jgi:small redox-active disulfide protein 2